MKFDSFPEITSMVCLLGKVLKGCQLKLSDNPVGMMMIMILMMILMGILVMMMTLMVMITMMLILILMAMLIIIILILILMMTLVMMMILIIIITILTRLRSLLLSVAAGGITHDTFQKELMCFDPDADKWTQKAPMTTVRGLHCMCTVGDRLYVIGGNHFRGTSDYDDVLSCEYYSPALDLWTPISPMLRGQSDVGVAVFESKIYVVGGYSWNNRCMVEIVQKYDPEKDEWHKVFDLPESLGGIRACTLTVFPPEDLSGSPSRESPLSAP